MLSAVHCIALHVWIWYKSSLAYSCLDAILNTANIHSCPDLINHDAVIYLPCRLFRVILSLVNRNSISDTLRITSLCRFWKTQHRKGHPVIWHRTDSIAPIPWNGHAFTSWMSESSELKISTSLLIPSFSIAIVSCCMALPCENP